MELDSRFLFRFSLLTLFLLLIIKSWYEFASFSISDWQPTTASNSNYPKNLRQKPTSYAPSRVVISLTTIPRRIHKLKPTLDSLLQNQTMPANVIQINIPQTFLRTGAQFNSTDQYPFLKHDRIRIVRCIDTGPSTKLLPTLATETDPSTLIIIVDDDTIYPSNLVASMVAAHRVAPNHPLVAHPGDVLLSNRKEDFLPLPDPTAKLTRHQRLKCCVHFFEAFGGVGYRRGLFDQNAIDFQQYMAVALGNTTCFRSDDLLISNYFALNNIHGIDLRDSIEVWQLPHGFESGPDGALHQLSPTRHPYYECSQYLFEKGIGKLRFPDPVVLQRKKEERARRRRERRAMWWRLW